MSIINDFKSRFPEFNSDTVDLYANNLLEMWPAYYGGEYSADNKETILNLIAHLLYDEAGTGAQGIKVAESKTLGNMNIKYSGVNSASQSFFSRSKYGQRFERLISHDSGGVAV